MSEFGDSFHQLTASIISQLTAFLQLRYRANDQTQTPFATHPTTMFVAVSSFVVYYLIHVVLLRSPASSFAAVAQHFVVWSGYTAVSTLVAAIFPDRASPFLYVIFGLLSAGEVLHIFGDKLVTEEEDEDVDEEEEGGVSNFKIYRRRVYMILKNIWCERVVKFFRKKPQSSNILPL